MANLAAFLPSAFALLQVIVIDVALSGDNAIIIGMAAAGLPPEQRRKAIAIGVGAAIVLRVAFASAAIYLLAVPGVVLVGGLMLVWVCVKMWRELRAAAVADQAHVPHAHKSIWQAVMQITVADVSMSLDNVLAVAGGAGPDHAYVMAFGLLLSIAMMAVAANAISSLLHRWPSLNYAGLLLIAFVAARMIFEGSSGVRPWLAALR